ncbi:MAG: DUF4405 domain-containing protein [Hyphomicrobiales bacterium]|nr:MAG: DUF4405 domain-containing protein [Hyphomicrobiales bacterium]
MKKSFLLRLVLDGIAAGALLVAIAYYWLGNLTHEVIGTGIFLLVLLHNFFNRRWWGKVKQAPRAPRGWVDLSLTFTLLAAMLALLLTSVWISQSVFSFLAPPGGFTSTRIHALAAHWVVILVAVHLGIRWTRVMHAARSLFGLADANRIRTALMRLLAVATAGFGLQSSFAMEVGTKLAMQMSLEWWDFEASAPGFFVRWISILGLYVFLTHYTLAAVHAWRGRSLAGATSPKG